MSLSIEIGKFLKENELIVITAESCTAGLIASTLAETPKSSTWLDSGLVVYSPHAKHLRLGVKYKTIEQFDITSCEVALEMAKGALKNSRANVAVSTTGVAGPGGGTDEIPVGTVCFAWVFKMENKIHAFSEKKLFLGTRNEIREQATEYSLRGIETLFKKLPR